MEIITLIFYAKVGRVYVRACVRRTKWRRRRLLPPTTTRSSAMLVGADYDDDVILGKEEEAQMQKRSFFADGNSRVVMLSLMLRLLPKKHSIRRNQTHPIAVEVPSMMIDCFCHVSCCSIISITFVVIIVRAFTSLLAICAIHVSHSPRLASKSPSSPLPSCL